MKTELACDELARAIKTIFWYKQLEPDNLAEQKRSFIDGDIEEPTFTYPEPSYDVSEMERELLSITIPEGPLAPLIRKSRAETLLLNSLVRYRGDPGLSRSISVELWGAPDEELIADAHEILSRPRDQEELTLDADAVENAFIRAVEEYGLDDWQVEMTERSSAGAYPERDPPTLCVPANRKYAENDPARLAAHEVAVHALRHSNGSRQGCALLTIGTAGFLDTEEGLALYAEESVGGIPRSRMRLLALRVVAAAMMLEGRSFREVFAALQEHGLSEELSWETTYRAFRGGGNTKDIVYLRGLRRVERHVDSGGDLHMLFLGKIGLGDLAKAKECVAQGLWTMPERLPKFL